MISLYLSQYSFDMTQFHSHSTAHGLGTKGAKHLTREGLTGGSGFLTTGVLITLGAGISRELLEFGSRDDDSGCTREGVLGTILIEVFTGFRGASGG